MSVETKEYAMSESADNGILQIRISGKLKKSDFAEFVPKVEAMIAAHGKVRILLYLHDFQGWSVGALWEDVKFDLKHFNDIERLAIVGESRWQEGMSAFCKPFTTAQIKYFDHSELPAARQWIEAD